MENKNLPKPINISEQYLYGLNMRLEVIIEQMSSFLNYIASKENIAVVNNTVENEIMVAEEVVETPVETVKKTRGKKKE